MRICKIWDADYPWDIRVEKIVTSLTQQGHRVCLVARNNARRNSREELGNFVIRRLPITPQWFGTFHTLWNFPFPLNPVWITAIARAMRQFQPDVILVRDLPLILPAIKLGRTFGLPVVLDMAENYPAMLSDRLRYTPTGKMAQIVRHPALARAVERLAIRKADHIIVVIEESKERLIRAGVPPQHVTIVRNTPRRNQWNDTITLPGIAASETGLRLVYLGNLDGSRGIDTAIHAIGRMKAAGCDIRLIAIGDGPCLESLRDLARRLNVQDRVHFPGRLPFRKVRDHLATSHIGLISHYVTDAWDSTIPNKLFDYMALGLPVIVSDARPTARIVREEECGEVFRDRDPADLERCIRILQDPDTRCAKGQNGWRAVHWRYNWETDFEAFTSAINAARSFSHESRGAHEMRASRM